MTKLSLIGGGNIGATIAHSVSIQSMVNNISIVDINNDLAHGKALDIMHSISMHNTFCNIVGSNDYSTIENSDVIVVTAGLARKPGMSRDDLIAKNLEIIKTVSKQIKKYASNAFVIVVTNPLDVIVSALHKFTGFLSNKVVGMAGVLDSSRFSYLLSKKIGINPAMIQSIVLGGHGDTMVPMIRYCSVGGIPLPSCIELGLIAQNDIDEAIEKTRHAGAEIVSLYQNGSAFYSPATSVIRMIRAYLTDAKDVVCCAAQLSGQYGITENMFIGVPVVIGKSGVEKIIELNLTDIEKQEFDKSVGAVRQLIAKANL